jgi:hypothetical protein
MQKIVLAFLLLMLHAIPVKSEEIPCCDYPYIHTIKPLFTIYGHHEHNYNFIFPLIGLEYSFHKYDGIDLELSLSAGFKNQAAFIYDYAILGYSIPTSCTFLFRPFLSFENMDHFFKNNSKRDITFIRNRFLIGLKMQKIMGNIFRISISPQLFKDFDVCAYFFRDSHNFWGKRYDYPIGYKANGIIEYCTAWTMDVIVGAFYLETFKRNYKEYGGSLGLAWNF